MPVPGLKTHKPTGAVPFPVVLLEGEEHAGKSWSIAEFAKCEKIGEMYWLAIGEGNVVEMYGQISDRYEVVEFERGDYHEVLDAVQKIRAHAAAQKAAGAKPVVLVIDGISPIWERLKDWVTERAASSNSNKALLAKDPNADIKVPRHVWPAAHARWSKLLVEMRSFPGIVIVTARGKWVSKTGPTGQPVEGQKEWSVETHTNFPYASDVWVRYRRDAGAGIVGVRSVKHGKKPGDGQEVEPIVAKAADGRLLEWLLFDVLEVNLDTAYVADYKEFEAGGLLDHERGDEDMIKAIAEATTIDRLVELRAAANTGGFLTPELDARMKARRDQIVGAQPAAAEQPAQPAATTTGDVLAKARQRKAPATRTPAAAPTEEEPTPAGVDRHQPPAAAPSLVAGPEHEVTAAETAVDAADAASDARRAQTDEELRKLLLAELELMTEIHKTPAEKLTARIIGDAKPAELPMGNLIDLITVRLRPMTVLKLRGLGHAAMADAYAKFGPGTAGTRDELLGKTAQAA